MSKPQKQTMALLALIGGLVVGGVALASGAQWARRAELIGIGGRQRRVRNAEAADLVAELGMVPLPEHVAWP